MTRWDWFWMIVALSCFTTLVSIIVVSVIAILALNYGWDVVLGVGIIVVTIFAAASVAVSEYEWGEKPWDR